MSTTTRTRTGGIETRRLGRTGHESSVAILGGAGFWECDTDTAAEAFSLALAAGVNHLDIAPSYGHAELVVGPLVPPVRDRLFVAEKTARANRAGVRAQLETSLTRLGCEQFDLYQAHGVTDLADLDRRAGAFEAILAARDEGLTRFVGITGHDLGTAAAQLEAVRRYDVDTVMFPVYPGALAVEQYRRDVGALLEECAQRDVGVMAIKAVARRPWGTTVRTHTTWYEPWTEADRIAAGIRFTLSMPGVHAFCTPGDVRLLPDVLAAAAELRRATDDETQAQLAAARDEPIIFPIAENAPR
jgi:aryl-alcohol dehydrogenase-like predicted oxidoreductase